MVPNDIDIADSSNNVALLDEAAQTPEEMAMTDDFYKSGRVAPGDGHDARQDAPADKETKPKSDSEIMESETEEKPPEEKPAEAPAEKPEKKAGLWDHDRQARDMALANAAKLNEAHLKTIAELTDVVKGFSTKAGPAPDDEKAAREAKVDELLASLSKTDDEGGMTSTAEDVAKVLREIRAIDAKAGTGAKTRVLIESSDKDSTWNTVGVDENIIEASWQALVDSIEYKLMKDERSKKKRVPRRGK